VYWYHDAPVIVVESSSGTQALFSLDEGRIIGEWKEGILRTERYRREVLAKVVDPLGKESLVPAFAMLVNSDAPSDFSIDESSARFLRAIENGDERGVLEELARGADIDKETTVFMGDGVFYLRPVHVALMAEMPAILKLLVERGADLRYPMLAVGGEFRYAELPLIYLFLANDDIDTVVFLLDNGAPADAEIVMSQKNETVRAQPLFMAMEKRDISLCKKLLELGADANAVMAAEFHGESQRIPALHFAYSEGGTAALELLLEHGADPRTENEAGETVLDIALRREDRAAVQIIEAALQHRRDP
jgi:hypothetical protein